MKNIIDWVREDGAKYMSKLPGGLSLGLMTLGALAAAGNVHAAENKDYADLLETIVFDCGIEANQKSDKFVLEMQDDAKVAKETFFKNPTQGNNYMALEYELNAMDGKGSKLHQKKTIKDAMQCIVDGIKTNQLDVDLNLKIKLEKGEITDMNLRGTEVGKGMLNNLKWSGELNTDRRGNGTMEIKGNTQEVSR
jgi:hypothetical protein